MTTAISAQGSKLEISGAIQAAKSITGLALGFPTIVTSPAHGFNNGDVVTFAALAGNTVLNGLTLVIKNKTANSYAVDVDTTGGAAYSAGGNATPVAWIKISNLLTFKGFDGQAAELDATNLDSTAKEYLLGLQDNGTFTFDVHRDFADAGQQAVDAAKRGATLKSFKLTLPNARTKTFNAYVKNSPLEGAVDQLVKTTGVNLRITGDVVDA
ncbi:MAG: phage tail tube protein [Collimonas pratensis]|uniref:phage tail tube protein n=1 Tax=Collimonas pratensis TaxID=279113 RepID=UPI003C785340